MTVSEYVFEFLRKKGVKNVFMVSGSSAMWLTDALKRNDKLNAYCCHHEQVAAMAADGCGRVEDTTPGVCLVTIGPGATNAITGVAEAYLDSSPMFILSGQTNSRILEYQIKSGIRQKGTQSLVLDTMVSPITKYFARVMLPESIRYHMEKAYYMATEGRKGPVWLDIPVDIQNKQIPDEMEGFIAAAQEEAAIDIHIAAEKLLAAQKPLVMAGYGVRTANCCDKLLEICEKHKIPIVTSRGGIDVISSDNPLFVGRPGSYGDRASHFAIQECDFLLILGSRLSVSTIGYYPERFGKNAYKVMVDIDKKELGKKDVPIDEKFNCNIADFLDALERGLSSSPYNEERNEWVKHCNEMKEKYPVVIDEYREQDVINSYYFTEKLSEITPENTMVVVDTGSVCNIVSQAWKIKRGQRYIISGGLSCMGFWASAIGLSTVKDKVIALAGDGSTQMNIQDFATIKYNNLPLKLFIYNNNGYMLIRHNQHNYMQDRFLGVGPDSGVQTPDFCKVAEAYGLKAVRISDKSEIDQNLKEVFEYDGPVVCEVMVEEFGIIAPRIASKVMPDGSLKAAEFDDLWPFLDRE